MNGLVMGALVAAGFLVSGCSDRSEQKPAGPSPTGLAESAFLSAAPGPALEVSAARKDAASGAKVIVRGKLKDFVPGFAAFTLADHALKPCNEIPGDECKTPWDYCCADPDELTAGLITVEFQDGSGRPHRQELKGWQGLDHLQSLVIQGEAVRDDAGNLLVKAVALHREQR